MESLVGGRREEGDRQHFDQLCEECGRRCEIGDWRLDWEDMGV